MNRKSAVLPVFLAFLAMGFGDAVGPFVSLAREKFQLSNWSSRSSGVPWLRFLSAPLS